MCNPKNGRSCAEARVSEQVLHDFAEYYNKYRSHMERDHLPPLRDSPDEVATVKMDEFEVMSHVGGLVKSLERKAA